MVVSTSPTLHRLVTSTRKAGIFFLLALGIVGCASRGDVREGLDRLDPEEQRMATLQARLDSLQSEIQRSEAALAASAEELAAARAEAALASEQAARAEAAATGNLAGETVFRVDGVGFEPGTSILTETARTLLDQLADRLRAENAAYFLEIQSFDRDTATISLGVARVDAVRRYLHEARGFPLHSIRGVAATASAPHAVGEIANSDDPGPGPVAVADELTIVVVRDLPQR
jgi:hypothetical protein